MTKISTKDEAAPAKLQDSFKAAVSPSNFFFPIPVPIPVPIPYPRPFYPRPFFPRRPWRRW
jgi:hypothetical protein